MELLKFEVQETNIDDLMNNPNLKFHTNYIFYANGGINTNEKAYFKGFYFEITNSKKISHSKNIIVEGNYRTYWEYMHENSEIPNSIDIDLVLGDLFKKFNFLIDKSDIKFLSFKIHNKEFIGRDDNLPF